MEEVHAPTGSGSRLPATRHGRLSRVSWRHLAVAATSLACAVGAEGCGAHHNAYASHRSPGPAFEFRNDLPQAVGVYARRPSGDGEVFLRFVEPSAVDTIPLRGFRLGQTVRLRAVTVSGDRRFERDELVIENAAAWRVP